MKEEEREIEEIVMKMKPWLDKLRAYDMGEWDPDLEDIKPKKRRRGRKRSKK